MPGAIPGVRHLFFGTSRALGFVTDTLTILGNAMIPAALLVVGSVLQKGPGGKAVVPYRVLAGVVVARLFILPITGRLASLSLRSRKRPATLEVHHSGGTRTQYASRHVTLGF